MSLEVLLQAISVWWSRFFRVLSADWISTAVTRARVSSPIRQVSIREFIWILTRRLLDFSRPSLHWIRQEVALIPLVHLPTFVLRCWQQQQVIAAKYLTLLWSSLMDDRVTLLLRRSVENILVYIYSHTLQHCRVTWHYDLCKCNSFSYHCSRSATSIH